MGQYEDSELLLNIENLSSEEKSYLAKRLRPEIIKQVFTDIKTAIAIEAKRRIQSKIATTFIRGYSTGALMESIYYNIEGDTITLSSTKSYFAILNAGYDAFDMKKAFAGKRIKMRLPGGAVIYRTCPEFTNTTLKKGKPIKRGDWIHPGYQGVHIYKQVEKEMELWIKTYVREQIESLIKSSSGKQEIYQISNSGRTYYSKRDKSGRFTTPYGKMLREDLLTFNYITLKNGSQVPSLKRNK